MRVLMYSPFTLNVQDPQRIGGSAMNHDDRSDRDVCQRRRRRGAYAAVLSAAAGAALAAAMIPAAPAFADPADDAVGAAGICLVDCIPTTEPALFDYTVA